MPREIKTTIAVDGEQAFKRAINDANTSLRNMGTQLTLASAQFKKDGDAMKLMETRSKALRGEIGQQEEIVKALEKAVTDSTKAYGENSQKTEKWEAELNRAKAKLVSLQSELKLNDVGLDRNGKAFDESSQKAADYQATLQGIGKNVSFETISSGIGGITKSVENAAKKVLGLARTIREAFAEAGEWADDLNTKSVQFGIDTDTLQRWEYASQLVDTDVDTIVSAQDKLAKKIKNGWSEDEVDMWELLHIDTSGWDANDANGRMDILFDVGEKLLYVQKLQREGQTELDADVLSMQLFGKSWRDMLPLFNAGREAWKQYNDEAQIVSKERVDTLAEMDDASKALQNSWDVTKYSFLAELAPAITDITNAVSGMLKEFNAWMETEDGKKAMEDLSNAIRDLFSGLTDLKFADVIDGVKTAINGIKDVFVWISEHKNDLVKALEAIGIAFAGMKLATVALNIGKIVNGFRTLWNGANKPLPSTKNLPTDQPTTTPSTQPTTTSAPASAPNVAPTTIIPPAAAAVPTATSVAGQAASYATIPGLAATAGEAGMGGALGGAGALSLAGALGGTAIIAGGVFLLSEAVNTLNDAARREREVDVDVNRFTNFGEQKDYSFGVIDKRDVITQAVNALISTTGDTTGANGPKEVMKRFAENMGKDILEAFDFEGGAKNKLLQMLGMDDQNAMAAAMMLYYAGIDVNDSRLSNYDSQQYQVALQKWKNAGTPGFGNFGPTEGLVTIRDFFNKSGQIDENGAWYIPGYEGGGNGTMPVINGVPLANMSGYVMTRSSSKKQYVGTWDPSTRMTINDALADTMYNTGAGGSGSGQGGITGDDIRGFKKVPSEIATSAENGVRKGVNGLRVTIDGEAAGRILAPYINQELAKYAQ